MYAVLEWDDVVALAVGAVQGDVLALVDRYDGAGVLHPVGGGDARGEPLAVVEDVRDEGRGGLMGSEPGMSGFDLAACGAAASSPLPLFRGGKGCWWGVVGDACAVCAQVRDGAWHR